VAGGVTISLLGGGVAVVGQLVVLAGGVLQGFAGNPQPAQAAAIDAAQTALDQTTHMPDALPSPFTPAFNSFKQNMEVGVNGCPE